MSGLRIAYAGTPDFAVPALETLLKSDHQVVLVITQPDRPAGRGRKLTPSPVKVVAANSNIPILQPQNVNTPEFLSNLHEFSVDILVVAAFGQLFGTQLLALPRLGCVNIHASLLPRWRGASPIQHAILAGDSESGITIMQMVKRMDAGDIWLQTDCEIQVEDTGQSLHDKLAAASGSALLKTIDLISSGKAEPRPQNDTEATYCEKLQKSDGLICWQETADTILRKIRAYYPWPGAYTTFNGRRLVVISATEEETSNEAVAEPGMVISVDKNGILVSTANKIVRIKELVPAGGKRVSGANFANSNHILQAVLGVPE